MSGYQKIVIYIIFDERKKTEKISWMGKAKEIKQRKIEQI